MPDEYVLTGASMNSRSSAKSTISSNRSLNLTLRQAEHDAVDEHVLPAGSPDGSRRQLDQRRNRR
jgi:hypothetical protein